MQLRVRPLSFKRRPHQGPDRGWPALTSGYNMILARIGQWHDGEITGPTRKISPLRQPDLRHTFAFQLAGLPGPILTN